MNVVIDWKIGEAPWCSKRYDASEFEIAFFVMSLLAGHATYVNVTRGN
jgi:hypothetical protein